MTAGGVPAGGVTGDGPTVGVLLGGRSSEHEISCVSAGAIAGALHAIDCPVRLIGIDREGGWRVLHALPEAGGPVLPQIVGAAGRPVDPCTALAGIDVVFPVLHGPWGEDGSVQGLLETLGIAYVGSGVAASAVGMDKGLMKDVLTAAGVPTGAYLIITPRAWREEPAAVLDRIADLGSPVFVKPARAGSSVGIVRVANPAGVPEAISAAMAHDPRVIVEQAVVGREIEIGVLERADGRIVISVPGEIVVRPGFDFYDYAAKYLADGAELLVPMAGLADAQASGVLARIEGLARAAFDAIGCEGLARVDMFLTDTGTVLLNELNTMPGFTPISMYPRLFQASGLDYPSLVSELIAQALRRPTGLR